MICSVGLLTFSWEKIVVTNDQYVSVFNANSSPSMTEWNGHDKLLQVNVDTPDNTHISFGSMPSLEDTWNYIYFSGLYS